MCHACDEAYLGVLRRHQGGGLNRREMLGGLGVAALAGLSASCAGWTPGASADRILLGRVRTLDDRAPTAEGVAIHAGKIVAVGSRDTVLRLRGAATDVVDLGRQTVLPGFVDPHMHSNFCSLRPWLDIGPFTTDSIAAALDKLHAAAKVAKEGEWVQGKMLDPSLQAGPELTRHVLDRIAPKVPVFILEANGHVAYVNTPALQAAGLTRDSVDPPQSRLVRDAEGELTGRLEEAPAFLSVVAKMPSPTQADLVRFLRADLDDGARRGCTTLHDCGIGGVFGEEDLSLLDAVMATDPPVRYGGFLVSTHYDRWRELGLRPGERSARFYLTGIKAWADGSNQARTGYQREPYLGAQTRGVLNYTPEEIESVIARSQADGWSIGVHANGDAAIDVVLDAFAAVQARAPASRVAHRNRIEHCSLLHDEQIVRMKELGISPSFLIGHVHYWGTAFQQRLLGPKRAELLDRCASALAGGLKISLHSDYNVTPIDPLRCIQNAVVRDMREGGGVLNPSERITPLQAIRAMTIDAAWQCHLDHVCGSLEVGKAADCVVLEEDPLEVAPDQIQEIPIHSTWLDGEQRFVG